MEVAHGDLLARTLGFVGITAIRIVNQAYKFAFSFQKLSHLTIHHKSIYNA